MSAPITVAQVVEKFVDEHYRNNPKASGEFRSNIKRWCQTLGSHLQANAEELLGPNYSENVGRYREHLTLTRPDEPNASKNVRTSIGRLHAAYHAMLASADLPADFTAAFRAAMDAKGMKPVDLNRDLYGRYFKAENEKWYGAQLWTWYNGTGGPGRSWKGDSKVLLARCEEVLGLTNGALVSRAYPPNTNPVLLAAPHDIPFRVNLRAQHGLNYALRTLPRRISAIFEDYADWRSQHIVEAQNGEMLLVEDRSKWGSPRTRQMHLMQLRRFFGWLCLPASTKPVAERSDEETWHSGMGMEPKALRMSHLLDTSLILRYLEFLRGRQVNHVYSKTHMNYVFFVNGWVSCKFSYLPNHPQHASEFGMRKPASHAEWLEAVEEIHQRILVIKRMVVHEVDGKQRKPDEPLSHVINHANPYNLIMESIARAEQSPPLRANRCRWAVWARDIALLRMQMDVALRARNVVSLELRRHLRRVPATGQWRVVIAKSELKNHYSKQALDIDRPYSEATCKAIDRYVDEARPDLIGARQSQIFFLVHRRFPGNAALILRKK